MTNEPTTKTCSRCGKTFTGEIYLCVECDAELEKSEGKRADAPTTGEIVRALRDCSGTFCNECICYISPSLKRCQKAELADRLESQEQKLELLNGGDFDVIDIPAALAYLESVEEILPHASALIDLIQSLKGTAIELTARAEQAEKERDALVKSVDRLVEAWENFKSPALIELVKQWRGQPQEGEGK